MTAPPKPPARRFQPYPAYKDSGIEWLGEIPAHWQTIPLKRLVDPQRPVTYGIVQCGPDLPEGVPYIRPVDMTDDGGIRAEALQRTAPEIAAAYKRSTVRAGDIVVSIGPSFGKVMIVPFDLDGANLTQGTARVAPAKGVAPRFLFWALRSDPSRQAWESYCAGATFSALTLETLDTCEIALPTPDEQPAIAAFLDRETAKIDALVEKNERLFDLLQEKRTALITRAVTKGLDPNAPMKDSGVEWLGEIPAHWEVKRVRDIADSLQTGPFGSQLHADEYIVGGIPIVNPANIRDSKLFPDENCTVDDAIAARLSHHRLLGDDILFARRGELGRCGLVTGDQEGWLCGTGCLRLRIRAGTVRPRFLEHLLSTSGVHDWLQLQSVGSTMQNLNTSIIGRIPIAFPMSAEQEAIASHADDETAKIDALVAKVRVGIEQLTEYRTALISAAVTGKIDVRGETA